MVFSYPSYWGAKERKFLERAAVGAGLVTKERASKCLHFVGEAEAVATYALTNPSLKVR